VIVVRIAIQLFAVAKQLAGRPTVEVELRAEATVDDLRRALTQQVPALAGIAAQLKFALDEEYAADTCRIAPGARVACIPPVSGG
jgi:molybdopterin converting factor subunit 1